MMTQQTSAIVAAISANQQPATTHQPPQKQHQQHPPPLQAASLGSKPQDGLIDKKKLLALTTLVPLTTDNDTEDVLKYTPDYAPPERWYHLLGHILSHETTTKVAKDAGVNCAISKKEPVPVPRYVRSFAP